MNWEEYVQNFSLSENPDYRSISFLFPEIERKQPSFFTRLNSHLLSEFVLLEQNKAIIVYPNSDDFVISVVFFQLIEKILSGDADSVSKDDAELADKLAAIFDFKEKIAQHEEALKQFEKKEE